MKCFTFMLLPSLPPSKKRGKPNLLSILFCPLAPPPPPPPNLQKDCNMHSAAAVANYARSKRGMTNLLMQRTAFLMSRYERIGDDIITVDNFRLRKGSAQNLDLFVVAILNCFLSVMGLPWMHGALPHSPLHLRALADVEERVLQGHVHEVYVN